MDQATQLAADASAVNVAAAGSHAVWPLTPFETLMWRDDRPGYPMVCYCESTYLGEVDRAALQKAANLAIGRHPLLRSRIIIRNGAPAWHEHPDAEVEVIWQTEAEKFPQDFWRGLDLSRQNGVRFVVHASRQRSRILMQLHHAAADGIGGFVFLGDVLGYYHHLMGGELPSSLVRPLDESLLATRGAIVPPPAPPSSAEQLAASAPPQNPTWDAIKHAWRFATFRPARVAPPPAALEIPPQLRDAPDKPPYVIRSLSSGAASRLRAFASSKSVWLNDVLLRDLFLTIDARNRGSRRPWSRRRLRILMPLSMRAAQHRRLPAANLMSYGFLQRTPEEMADSEKLLAGIAWETHGILQFRLGNLLLGALEQIVRFPRLFGLGLRAPAVFATGVLSNLGDPLRRMHCKFPRSNGRVVIGNLQLESTAGVPPVRPGTAVAIALTTCNEAITFMAVGCPRTLGREGAAALVDAYLARLEQTAAEAPLADANHPEDSASRAAMTVTH